ncbi:MAG: hypothetical protein HDR82_10515 [Bacteroides sp.]|nr:hypothetical protein [Bacteroides sp.]
MSDKKNNSKTSIWLIAGAIVLIALVLVWTFIADSNGDPNNGFITPLINML